MAISPPGSDQEDAMPTTKIFNGTEWIDLQGPEGPTVVSADLVNVARLGTDGKILVSQADLDARYTNITGDTMTGQLIVQPSTAPAAPFGVVQVIGNSSAAASISAVRYSGETVGSLVWVAKARGSQASPQPVQAGDILGQFGYRGMLPSGSFGNGHLYYVTCSRTPVAGDTTIDCIVQFGSLTMHDNRQTLTKFFTGLNWTTPSCELEVGGNSILRGTLDVTGDITSSGTAHSFAAGSIPSPAVIGSTAFTPASSAAPGTAGTMRWDASYLYICVAANSWKRVALTAF